MLMHEETCVIPIFYAKVFAYLDPCIVNFLENIF